MENKNYSNYGKQKLFRPWGIKVIQTMGNKNYSKKLRISYSNNGKYDTKRNDTPECSRWKELLNFSRDKNERPLCQHFFSLHANIFNVGPEKSPRYFRSQLSFPPKARGASEARALLKYALDGSTLIARIK